jgi:hypothetical protein
LAGILWTIIVILFIFWLLGFMAFHLGSFIHIVLLIVIVLVLVNLLTGRGLRV